MKILIKNGIIVTMNDMRSIMMDGAIYIESNKIIEIGETSNLIKKYAADSDRIINAKNKIILPGFINIHAHATLAILRGQAEDEDSFTSVYGKMFPINDIITGKDTYHIAKSAYVELLKFGSTTIVDNFGSIMDVAQAAYEVGNRVFINDTIRDADVTKVKEGIYEYVPSIGEETLQKTIDLIETWHMKDEGRIRCLMGPHGTDTCSPDLMKKIRDVANKYQIGITIHLAQNKTEIEQVKKLYGMSTVEYLESVGILGTDFIGAHGTFLEEKDMKLLAKYGANMAHCPVIYSKRGFVAPLAGMFKEGINVALGTDNFNHDIIQEMKAGLMAYRIKNNVATEPKPEKMLEMATINGAKALGIEKELGSIEVGKIADLVLLDCNKPNYIPLFKENVISNIVHTGLSSDIDMVMVGGKILVENSLYIKEDENEIMSNFQYTAEKVWNKWHDKFS